MVHTEFSIQALDGIKLFVQEWKPEGEIKAAIVLVHGLGEHSSRYKHVAQVLTQNGYAIISFDLRGHGRSAGKRGHAQSYKIIMSDIDLLVAETQKRVPNKPVYLYGHSLGGNLVLYYAFNCDPKEFAGIISTSPGLSAGSPVPGWKVTLAQVMSRLTPSLTMNNGLDLSGLSRDPLVITAYKNDPLVHDAISFSLAKDLLQSGPWIIEHVKEFPPIPLLVLQGSADRIVNPTATQQFAENVTGDKTFVMWDGGYHELHNEPEKDEILKILVDWLDKHNTPAFS